MQKFKFIPHTADIKFQAFGKTLKEVFENSALALFKIMNNNKIKETKKFKIQAKGDDFESLMYNFLEQFLILFDTKNFIPSKIKNLKLDGSKGVSHQPPTRGAKQERQDSGEKKLKINAEVFGDSAKNYEISMSVKAITYNEMFIKKNKSNWISQVVLDV